MIPLYYLPYSHMILLVMVLCLALAGQILCLGIGFFKFRPRKGNSYRTLLEIFILVQQFLLLVFAAETIYNLQDGFLVVRPRNAVRVVIFTAIFLSSITVCVSERTFLPLITSAVGVLPLPLAEAAAGRAYPILLEAAAFFWLIRAVLRLNGNYRRLRSNLSVLSVKEAIDTMDFGILFCRAQKNVDGQILLCNEKMQSLILALTGKQIYNNGKYFYDCLVSGHVLSECARDTLESQPVYTLPDGSVWRFELQTLKIGQKKYAVLLASNMTPQKKINDQLYARNAELECRNRELKAMLQNITSICRTEETLRAKRHVHNILGQQISLMLHSVREHKEPEEALLRAIAEGLPESLRGASASSGLSLKNLVRNFEALGITVHIDGSLPSRPELQRAFYEIITECMTNAVHHGYATEITVCIGCKEDLWTLDISNNGLSKEDSVLEGGGLTGIRQKVSELGGSFHYRQLPCFAVSVTVPKEDRI